MLGGAAGAGGRRRWPIEGCRISWRGLVVSVCVGRAARPALLCAVCASHPPTLRPPPSVLPPPPTPPRLHPLRPLWTDRAAAPPLEHAATHTLGCAPPRFAGPSPGQRAPPLPPSLGHPPTSSGAGRRFSPSPVATAATITPQLLRWPCVRLLAPSPAPTGRASRASRPRPRPAPSACGRPKRLPLLARKPVEFGVAGAVCARRCVPGLPDNTR